MNQVASYRKKPVIIQAIQHTGMDTVDLSRVFAFAGSSLPVDGMAILIPTLAGTMRANPGDWLIRGVQGHLYPCRPDIFAATYEAVEIPSPSQASEAPDINVHGRWETRAQEDGVPHCSYCGSLRIDTVLHAITQGARLELADLKYGWPHKFYVNAATVPRGRGKFYTEHLLDATPAQFDTFNRVVCAPRGFMFSRPGGILRWIRVSG